MRSTPSLLCGGVVAYSEEMVARPTEIYDAATKALECICAGLVADGSMEPGCCDRIDGGRIFVSNGDVAWDDCCGPCGQLSVKLNRVWISERPPSQFIGPGGCAHRTIVELEAMRLICAPVAENAEAGIPPLPSALDGNAEVLLSDLWVMWTALQCCFAEWDRDHRENLAGWLVSSDTIGPSGGCVAAVVTFQLELPGACQCDPSQPPVPVVP